MTLQFLEISKLRNIERQSIEFSPGINVLYGTNGSGKTSVLEAINILGTGKSFRTNQIAKAIQYEKDELLVFGKIERPDKSLIKIGIRRSRNETEVHLNGQKVQGLSELAKQLPIVVVTPESHRLLDSGPNWRRRFLDWGVFHVEHQYASLWSRFNQSLKQRNAALQTRAPSGVIFQWSNTLVDLGMEIDSFRSNHFSSLLPYLDRYIECFLPGSDIEFQYYQGWSKDKTLDQAIKESLDQDRAHGRTNFGPHRAEIRIKFNGMNAREAVSRGQQKLLVYAMNLAQTRFLYEKTGKRSLLLLDDLGAELDEHKIKALMALISTEFSQVVITSAIEESIPIEGFEESKLFHVEHGTIVNR